MGAVENTANLLTRIAINGYLTLAFRLAVGGAHILAGIAKAPHLWLFVEYVESYEILPPALSQAYGLFLPWAELVVGVGLIIGLFYRYASALSMLIFLSLAAANAIAIARGASGQCGYCFGDLGFLAGITVWQALVLDIVFLAMSVQILFQKKALLSLDSLLTKRRAAPTR